MTTIAVDLSEVAADSLCTTSDGTVLHGPKLYRTPLGIYGGAGDDAPIELAREWLCAGARSGSRPAHSTEWEFTGLVVRPGRLLLMDRAFVLVEYPPQPFAIGTGAAAALALLASGLTPQLAVARIIALHLDHDTGGTVQHIALRDWRRPRSARSARPR